MTTSNNQTDDLGKLLDIVKELNAAVLQKGQEYTNFIIIAGYGTFFALLNFTENLLDFFWANLASLCVAISTVIFVLFEMHKMYLRLQLSLNVQKTLDQQNLSIAIR